MHAYEIRSNSRGRAAAERMVGRGGEVGSECASSSQSPAQGRGDGSTPHNPVPNVVGTVLSVQADHAAGRTAKNRCSRSRPAAIHNYCWATKEPEVLGVCGNT
ncbi:hypothetical protein HPB48_016788 [Haemaphysalis longicornis]|uniref:Uncharacterized protein n=1 Tax=Haemaphysalis longicornis TaxID=44386 RepID=A0A9J6GPV8_HAELO|nr:hypothetical protein HPB48_016788 [Haemaphysalis longicornis]